MDQKRQPRKWTFDSDTEDRSSWTRWSTNEYEAEAFGKAKSIITSINAGNHPMGVINLLSGMPISVWYPYKEQAARMAERIWTQLQTLIADPNFPLLLRYNFEVSIRNAGVDLENRELATIVFRYNPDDVRDLKLNKLEEDID